MSLSSKRGEGCLTKGVRAGTTALWRQMFSSPAGGGCFSPACQLTGKPHATVSKAASLGILCASEPSFITSTDSPLSSSARHQGGQESR
ncbi:hypothetical protein AOLI_G00131720 [Acnodon oligacanthus]